MILYAMSRLKSIILKISISQKQLSLLVLLVMNVSGLIAQQKIISSYVDPGSEYENRVIDILHLEASVQPDTITGGVTGVAVYIFNPLRPFIDSITMVAPGIHPEYVRINNRDVRFLTSGPDLVISGFPSSLPASNNMLEIKYKSTGPYEPYFVGWDDPTRRMRRQIWAHRPTGWIPYINDRLTVDLTITFSSKYLVYSNGERISVTQNQDGTSSWHYRMARPHPFFSTALVIGKYAWKEMRTASGIPLEYWYYPDMEDHFEPTYRYSTEMFDFLEKELDVAYPWELYRQAPVADYLYGAMETTTATIFGDYMAIDERGWWGRNYVNVNVHELTHQWFGNYIAHQPGSDVWLTESLATYYAKLFEKSIFGNDYYEKERLSEQKKTFTQAEQDDFPLAHSRAGTFRWYQKGSLVLDMLRDEMGDSLFRKAMTHYLKKFAFAEASSHDFIKAFYEVTGLPLDWFFDQWLFHGGEPHFEVSFTALPDVTELKVRQIQPATPTTGPFRATTTVVAGYADGSTSSHRITLAGMDTTFRLPNHKRLPVSYIIFDSGNRLLKKITFNRTFSQLAAAATGASLAIDRYEALTAMRSFTPAVKRQALLAAARQSENELIYAEVLSQLGSDKDTQSISFFTGAFRHPDALIRRAAIENFTPLNPGDTARIVHLLNDPDYINTELALRKLCTFMPEKAGFWLATTAGETGWRGRNIRMAWLEMAVRSGESNRIDELKDFAGPSFDFETRINAIKALQSLGFLDQSHAVNLVEAYHYWNPKLSRPAWDAISIYSISEENRKLIESAFDQKGLTLPEFKK